MSYPKKLLRLQPHGIVRDIPSQEVSEEHYTGGRNIEFRDGFARRVPGWRPAYAPLSDDPLALAYTRLGGTGYWIYVSADEQHAADGSSHHELTLDGGLTASPNPWFHQLFLLNGLPIHNNSLDAPMWWDGNTSNEFDALPDWPGGTLARFMCAHRNFLFAMDLTTPSGDRHNTVMWSAAAEPGSVPSAWTPDASNLAGSVELADSDAPIITAATLNDALIVYKRGAVYSAHFTEDPSVVFVFRPVSTSFGALTRRSVVAVPGGHAVVSDGDVVLFDGASSPRTLIHGRMRNELFDTLDPQSYERLFVTYQRATQDLWVLVPVSGGTRAFVYNLHADAWTIREVPDVAGAAIGVVDDGSASDIWNDQAVTWEQLTRVWDSSSLSLARESLVFAVPDDSEMIEMGAGLTSLTSEVRREGLVFNDAARVKFVKRVHLRMQPGSEPVNLRVGARMNPTDLTTWGAPVAVNGDQVVNCFAQGRYIDIEVSANGTGPWGLTGIEVEAELRGYH